MGSKFWSMTPTTCSYHTGTCTFLTRCPGKGKRGMDLVYKHSTSPHAAQSQLCQHAGNAGSKFSEIIFLSTILAEKFTGLMGLASFKTLPGSKTALKVSSFGGCHPPTPHPSPIPIKNPQGTKVVAEVSGAFPIAIQLVVQVLQEVQNFPTKSDFV